MILRAVRVAPHPAYDRVVFEFAGDSAPGYEVEYADPPIRRCGSGDTVSLTGTGYLVVRFEPAQMHDERGNPTVARREWTPRLRAANEIKLAGFKHALLLGMVYWAVYGVFTKFGEVGNLPPVLAAWAANILFGIVGGYLFLHVDT